MTAPRPGAEPDREVFAGRREGAGGHGFSMVELLITIAIVAILALIAVQQMMAYRQRAYDARAMHDLGNAAAAEEAYFASNFAYKPLSVTGPAFVDIPGFAVSESVTINITTETESFKATSTSSKGSGKIFVYDSVTDTILVD